MKSNRRRPGGCRQPDLARESWCDEDRTLCSALSRMKYIVLAALLVLTAFADYAYACSIVLGSSLPPKPGLVRITGMVTGYGTATRPVPVVESAPTLNLRVQQVVSGSVGEGDTEVVLLFYEADCSSRSYERKELEKAFPVGSPVVVFGVDARLRNAGRPTVLAEMNGGAYVGRVPQDVTRTSDGDVDFQRMEDMTYRQYFEFMQFEFEKVILTLPKTTAGARVSRLRNLAHYHAFPYLRNAREFYAQLISTTGIPQNQRRALLEDFDQLFQKPR